MKKIKLNNWFLEFDYEKTKEFYGSYHLITDGCDCLNCKNFVQAINYLPTDVLSFITSFGIDPRKEGEISEYCENGDGTHLYGGFFHIVGRLISGPDVWVKTDEESTHSSLDSNLYELSDFSFGFTYGLSLVPEGFPEPVLQIEFQGNIPWVISEKPGNII